jgi:twitching motility protein PilT
MLTSPAELSSTTLAPAAPGSAGAGVAPHVAAPQPTATDAPIVREPAINSMFRRMFEMRASDLHLSATMAPMVRKDGEMRRLHDAAGPLSSDIIMQLLGEVMPAVNRAEFEARHDTDFAYEIAGLARFRANVFRDRQGAGAVFRVIPAEILTAEQLGLSPHVLALCQLKKGLVLVTGPTGSGKSTTLCAMIDHINKTRADHIITIEDPIEFVHQNQKCLLNQREVHTHTRSFKDALRAALREDPDVILVGELRDLETIAIAIETAETGHLVFGTLHTSTAASTVDRVIDQFPSDRQAQIRVMLSESLRGVIAQTLCRKVGGGRVAALEVLLTNGAISNLIREGKTFQIPSMMQVGRAQGMIALNDALNDLVKKGLITPDEALVRSVDKGGMAALLKR